MYGGGKSVFAGVLMCHPLIQEEDELDGLRLVVADFIDGGGRAD